MDTDSERAAYIKGLRALADVLEQTDDLPLPFDGHLDPITFHFLGTADPRAELAAATRAIPCDWTKRVFDSRNTAYFDLRGQLHGLKVNLSAFRDDVCERIVTGTHQVTETVKDPEALAAVPEIEVTKTVEDVEWRCGSILAPQGATAA
jgi:hypothetical protein